jgi:hypothetical protein
MPLHILPDARTFPFHTPTPVFLPCTVQKSVHLRLTGQHCKHALIQNGTADATTSVCAPFSQEGQADCQEEHTVYRDIHAPSSHITHASCHVCVLYIHPMPG